MTLNDIDVLIHCHVSPIPHPRIKAPAVRESIQSFLEAGLIYRSTNEENIYTTTERGSAHLSQLCNTELPTQVWTDQHGRILSDNGFRYGQSRA